MAEKFSNLNVMNVSWGRGVPLSRLGSWILVGSGIVTACST
jgi:hypothetical protein